MDNKLLAGIMGIVVSIILVGALLVPVIDNAKTVSGDVVYYNNSTSYTYALAESTDIIDVLIDSTGIYVNDEKQTDENDKGLIIVSDVLSLRTQGTNQAYLSYESRNVELRPSWSSYLHVHFANGIVTIEFPNETITYGYSWLFAPSENGEWVTITNIGARHYVNSVKDYCMTGYYESGEYDTLYSFRNGEVSAGSYDATLSYNMDLVDGTTDVYQISNFLIHIDDESFAPWFCLVKGEVKGHEVNEQYNMLYSAIPIIVIVAILGLAVFWVVPRNN